MNIKFNMLAVFFIIQAAAPADGVTIRDIGCDGKIGLEEAVYALQVTAGMKNDPDGVEMDSVICSLQMMSGARPQKSNFPSSFTLLCSGLISMAGAGKIKRKILMRQTGTLRIQKTE